MIRKVTTQMPWLILIIFLILFAAIVARVDDWKRDWTTNWAETDSEAKAADLRPLHSLLPPDALEQQVLQWVSEQTNWQLADGSEGVDASAPANSDDRSSVRLHLVRSTRMMQFKDDIRVTIDTDPESGGSVLRVKSRSRIGRGDLGQNPRNIKELVAGVKSQR